jgi:hypothetical protein
MTPSNTLQPPMLHHGGAHRRSIGLRHVFSFGVRYDVLRPEADYRIIGFLPSTRNRGRIGLDWMRDSGAAESLDTDGGGGCRH